MPDIACNSHHTAVQIKFSLTHYLKKKKNTKVCIEKQRMFLFSMSHWGNIPLLYLSLHAFLFLRQLLPSRMPLENSLTYCSYNKHFGFYVIFLHAFQRHSSSNPENTWTLGNVPSPPTPVTAQTLHFPLLFAPEDINHQDQEWGWISSARTHKHRGF